MKYRAKLLLPAFVVLALGLSAVIILQTWSALTRIDRIPEDEARTLSAATVAAMRGVVRYGPDKEGRVFAILEEISENPEVLTVGILEQDGTPAIVLGDPLVSSAYQATGAEALHRAAGSLTLLSPLHVAEGCVAPGDCSCVGDLCSCSGNGLRTLSPGAYQLVLVIDTTTSAGVRTVLLLEAALASSLLLLLAAVSVLLVRSARTRETLVREVLLEQQRSSTLESTSRLAAGLAHEIRNPLGAIRGYAQLTQERAVDDEARDRATVMLSELDRVSERLEEFLGFARKRKPALEAIDLNAVAAGTVTLMRPDAETRGIDLLIEAQPGEVAVQGDEAQLKELLLNLVLNALDACEAGDSVEVRTTLREGGAEISVTDTGRGMEQDVLPHIFEPYFTTRVDGSGLGLAISRRIAEDHRAVLDIRNGPDGGVVARLSFAAADQR